MMGTTHVAFVLLCYYVIAYFTEMPFDAPMVSAFLIVGSLLPDINHLRGFLARQSYLFKQTSGGIGKLVTHRGIVRSLLAALIATVIVWIIAMFCYWRDISCGVLFPRFYITFSCRLS